MTSTHPISPLPEILPNPHGGAVRAAEAALLDAQYALERRAPARAAFESAAAVLGEAGWLSAQRYAASLARAAQLCPEAPVLVSALTDFRAALARRSLRELACSPRLWAHYEALHAACAEALRAAASGLAAQWTEIGAETVPAAGGAGSAGSASAAGRTHAPGGLVAEYALAGRLLPPVTLGAQPPERVARARARYEAQLLGVLRAERSAANGRQAPLQLQFDELADGLAELAGTHPYDFWRLAAACARRQAAGGRLAKQWLARINLLFAEWERGAAGGQAPKIDRALLALTVALLWRDYALWGVPADGSGGHVGNDGRGGDVGGDGGAHADVTLLRDYGLGAEAGAAAYGADDALWATAAEQAAAARALGPVTVEAHAYEDFLHTADTALAQLAPSAAPAGAALQAAEAAYRVGGAAAALGLGQTALLADALGLAWRYGAIAGQPRGDPALLAQAAETLRAALYKIAAGMAPPDLSAARTALGGYLAASGGAGASA